MSCSMLIRVTASFLLFTTAFSPDSLIFSPLAGLRSPAARPAPIKFNRTGSSYDTGGDANATTSADDPRSPGVPRTPGGKESKTMANKTVRPAPISAVYFRS